VLLLLLIFFSAIPFFGKDIVTWLWGGFSVDNATLTRFYSLHFFLPFIILTLVVIHFYLLHLTGSNNPLGLNYASEGGITFLPYSIIKDLYGLFYFLMLYSLFLFFMPNILGHPDNYLRANPMVTPTHIVPEWYFLPFYAILRSIPDKLTGVLALVSALLTLFLLPVIIKPEVRSMVFRPFSKSYFWYFVLLLVALGWIGAKPIEEPFLEIGQVVTLTFFSYFYIIQPFIIFLEKLLWKPICSD